MELEQQLFHNVLSLTTHLPALHRDYRIGQSKFQEGFFEGLFSKPDKDKWKRRVESQIPYIKGRGELKGGIDVYVAYLASRGQVSGTNSVAGRIYRGISEVAESGTRRLISESKRAIFNSLGFDLETDDTYYAIRYPGNWQIDEIRQRLERVIDITLQLEMTPRVPSLLQRFGYELGTMFERTDGQPMPKNPTNEIKALRAKLKAEESEALGDLEGFFEGVKRRYPDFGRIIGRLVQDSFRSSGDIKYHSDNKAVNQMWFIGYLKGHMNTTKLVLEE